LIASVADDWQLEVGECYLGANISFAAPARRADGGVAVLKLQWPHRDCEFEADALRAWNGNGAPHLYDHDPARSALLIEHCAPGSFLADDASVDHIAVLIDLLPRLWIRASRPFTTLAEEAARLAAGLDAEWEEAARPCDRALVDAARAYLVDLAGDQGEPVLLHQDLHGHNVIASTREPWLVIDPKPLVGEREFGLSPIIRSAELGRSRESVLYRFDRLTSELGLDRQRARGWMIGQSVAWGIDGPPHILAMAQWLLETPE
jgi:streptomycin 6-kinase